MESSYIKLRKDDWAITIYREGGYSVSERMDWVDGSNPSWVESNEPEECPSDLVNDAKAVYMAMHGREMYW